MSRVITHVKQLCSRQWTAYRPYHTASRIYGHIVAESSESAPISSHTDKDQRLVRLVEAYRKYGHRRADLDPLKLTKPAFVEELQPSFYGLGNEGDLVTKTPLQGNLLHGSGVPETAAVSEIVQYLDRCYCGSATAEFDYLETSAERRWFAEQFERMVETQLSPSKKTEIARVMLKCQNFDHFLASKFSTIKRYGGEGAESMMAFFQQLFAESPGSGIEQIIVCIPHRGRLNLLTTLLEFPPVIMFQKMKGKLEFPPGVKGCGDVLSHLSASVDLKYPEGQVHVTMIPNPSHLEANNPVAVGKARGRMASLKLGDYSSDSTAKQGDGVLCLQVHGDASFSGQGIVAETSTMSAVPHFRVGGSVHLVVNNQIGFTTEAERGRSSRYCTDVAKMTSSPVIHVNGDDPESCAKVAKLALDYRQKFRKDVFIDLICFRRWGHNELDDPSFTQPLMYDQIASRKSVPDQYAATLCEQDLLSKDDINRCVDDHTRQLMESYNAMGTSVPKAYHLEKHWSGIVQSPSETEKWDTGVDTSVLKFVGAKSVAVPTDMTLHPHLKKTHCEARVKKIEEGTNLEWATAEALAFGSLLLQGYSVRLSGQDVGRGTFSHRHVMLTDRTNDQFFIPLNSLYPDQKAFIEVANSILSEEAVLGFEYGMSIENPKRLVIWEAQFGDFFNGAQIIIDTYVSSGESKWLVQNGLVMLLPHGYDGAGPEHSSSRIERFLQLCDSKETAVDGSDVNMEIVHPTTSAQYFHLLRRQMIRNYRKPLIVASPKILLRFPAASSTLADLAPGTHFQPVLGDSSVLQPSKITKVVLCSGKHFYALKAHRDSKNITDTAIVRLEALCPFPTADIREAVSKFTSAQKFVWSQEEPRNMGPWSFVRPRLENLLGIRPQYVGRPEMPIVATAIGEHHQQQHDAVINGTFAY